MCGSALGVLIGVQIRTPHIVPGNSLVMTLNPDVWEQLSLV